MCLTCFSSPLSPPSCHVDSKRRAARFYSLFERKSGGIIFPFIVSAVTWQSGGFVRNVNHDRDNSCRAKQRHLNAEKSETHKQMS